MRHIYTNLLLLGLIPLAACSNDDKSSPISPINEKTYTDSSGLELYYNGHLMPGKTVSFSQDGDVAKITAYSTFDLSRISGFGLSGQLPSPGIIPGSPQTTWNVSLENTGEYWEFSGNGENEFCTYSYEGYASPDKMKLYISDSALKTGGISPEAWKPAPIKKNNDGSYESLPAYAYWRYEPLQDIDINLTPFMSAIMLAPVIPVYGNTAYMSITEAIYQTLKAIAFLPDGNVIFSYISSTGGAYRLAQSYPNGYQYVVSSPGKIKLYVNPLSFFSFILQATSGSTPESDVDLNASGLWPTGSASTTDNTSGIAEIKDILSSPIVQKILKNVIPEMIPFVSEGIPLAYSVNTAEINDSLSENLRIYIDTEMAVGILSSIITPVLEDNETIEAVKKYIGSNPAFAPLLPDMEKAITLLPAAIEHTTVFNFGLNLIPYN
ncbi:MAG: hypothetical protein K2G52_08575 [Muribaculaceae bacterium]|nr:hypothetical protein [Muribaculaceae bacterium]